MCLFKFKFWWMIPGIGKSGREIPVDTQLLLLEAKDESAVTDEESSENHINNNGENTFYILILPVLDGQFRASLQGNSEDELELCIESGDTAVQTSQALEAVFINSGVNPFVLMRESINLSDAGAPPRFLIIDDGWQHPPERRRTSTRLIDIKENEKFKTASSDCNGSGLHGFVRSIKETYGLKYVYLWHALLGYWCGVVPTSPEMQKYNPKIQKVVRSKGNLANLPDAFLDGLEKYGVGFIDPEKIFDFYNDLHSYLASGDVDGVKVDAQNLVETVGAGFGGHVSLMQKCQQALEASISRNFNDNDLICCMCHYTDYIYSILLGEIVVPDWDMFQSKHEAAESHGAARAIGGCGVNVSDKPGKHDSKVLKKLVLPDGSVLRARYAGRPTRDCLFADPVMDGKSLLKIWNLNKFTGVLGVFNCQGAGIWPYMEKTPSESKTSLPISSHVSSTNVEFHEEVAEENWSGDCAIYAFNSGSLSRVPSTEYVNISLKVLQCEIYTLSPIRAYDRKHEFAPLGLINMYNSGGAIEEIDFTSESCECEIRIKGRGCGRFGAYLSIKPKLCTVDGKEEEFSYETKDGFMVIELSPVLHNQSSLRDILIAF
ncbi:hypothetical protein AMTR_s00166p00054410 [Amborella trichopoda]|uniref:Galactinol--sucrose galactosyltransferase n=1 Tax=Amborella trichopoda TaxID=13333 RepID=W1PKJ5_AMBTC|nr:hypothetical protein AMTR_s00166p00054410 [Amborella trichopoda]